MEKKNRREEYTKRAIRESFAQLLAEKPIEKISVGELCKLAEINRSTFYRHHSDLHALLDIMVDECLHEIFHNIVENRASSASYDTVLYDCILQVCAATERNKAIYKALLFGSTGTHLAQKIVDAVLQLYLNTHEPSDLVPAPETLMHYKYHVYGIIGMWSEWVRDDCALPKEDIAFAAKEQTHAFLYKMNELYLPKNYKNR